MRKVLVFNHVSLDGYFVDANSSMTWAKAGMNDPEWNEFVANNARGESVMLFGRITYELMAKYWPTAMAKEQNPVVAERMNAAPKIVFSKTLDKASWDNTKVLRGDLLTEMQKLKQEPGPQMVMFGSGTIVSQLAQHSLIDEYQFVINPVVLGRGRTLFQALNRTIALKLTKSRAFKNGNVLLSYELAT